MAKDKDNNNNDNTKYMEAYSESSLFDKIIKVGKKAGIRLIYAALLLYFTLNKSSTPKWAKTTIIGALGYFIFPVDAIPDFIPAAGFADDFGILIAAIGAVAMHIDDEVKTEAKTKLRDWFPNYDDSLLASVDEKIE